MKNVLLLALAFILYSCSSGKIQNLDSNDFFEGEIVYKIDYKPHYDQFTIESLQEMVGSKMVLSFKEGNFRKKYYSSNGSLLNERILDIDKNISYMKSAGNDTIYWIDVTKHDSETTFRQISDSIILGESCIGIATETVVSGVGFGDKAFNVSGQYYYSRNLNVDPNWYKDYLEGNFNEIIKIGQGVQLLYIDNGPYWKKTTTATSIERRKIDEHEFSIMLADDTILKEL